MVDWIWVALLSLTGVFMAYMTCFYGMPPSQEFPVWGLIYVAWFGLATSVPFDAPFLSILLASTFSGLLVGVLQFLWRDRWVQVNPWYAQKAPTTMQGAVIGFIGFGLGAGVLFGLVVGGLATAVA